MRSRMQKSWLALILVVVAGASEARDAAFEERLLQVIMNSPLSKLERAQHFVNRIANGSHPVRLSIESLTQDPPTTRAAAEKLVDQIVLNLDGRGEANAEILDRTEELYPLSKISDDQIIQRHAALPINEAGPFRARLRQVERAKLLAAMTLDVRGFKWRLFDFWFNHFNVAADKVSLDLPSYNRMLRSQLHGSFHSLLMSVATHPAMQLYLDNARSTKQMPDGTGPNENYAREIMELHTFGVGPLAGLYTQSDVSKVALVLTGWGVSVSNSGEVHRKFKYRAALHDMNPKTIMGITYTPQGSGALQGMNEGLEFIGHLAAHPRTAHNIIRKLVNYFVAHDHELTMPLRERMFSTWQNTDGNLEQVYKTMIASPEFWSQEAFLAKAKRPLDYVVSAAKFTGVTADTLDQQLVERMKQVTLDMGQELFAYSDPTGYPDSNPYWLNSNMAINAARFGFWVADYRVAYQPRYQHYLDWEGYLRNLYGQVRIDTANEALNKMFDTDGIDFRFNASENLRRGNTDGFFNLSYHRPDFKNGAARPLRTAVGIILGGKDFLKH